MEILATAWIAAAAACTSLAILQFLIWLQLREDRSYLLFALVTLAAAGVAIGEGRMNEAKDLDQFLAAFDLSSLCIALMLVAMAWFVVAYSGSKARLLVWCVTGGWAAALAAGSLFGVPSDTESAATLSYGTTPWGESFPIPPSLPLDASILLANAAVIALILLAGSEAFRTWRQNSRRRAILLGAIALFLLVAQVQATLVDFSLVEAPYSIGFLFLGIVVVANLSLASEVATAAFLSEASRADKRRWNSLVEGVGLLMVRTSSEGIVEDVNQNFLAVAESPRDDLLQKHYYDLFAKEDRDRVKETMRAVLNGKPPEGSFEADLKPGNGKRHTIGWRSAVIRDQQGNIAEVVSLGADRTERIQAERARDAAFAEITELKEQLEQENLYLREEIRTRSAGSREIVGDSEALSYVLYRVEQVAPTDITVLIQGETGVGKELVAQAVHERSSRSNRPFIRLNCATLGSNLVESELFGHVAGAFTDAKSARKGRFEMADGGTLFLDEVSEMPLEIQPKLLRVLQEGEFEPVGSSTTRQADVRLITATNRKLEDEVEAGRFREDLYYRLHVYPITVPPLRERVGDIPLLIEHFVPEIASRCGRKIREIPAGVIRELSAFSWPGNIRQLHNVLEEAVVASTDGTLRLLRSLSDEAQQPIAISSLRPLAEMERDHILRVLESCGGQIAGKGGAAEVLDLHPNTLRSRMKKLGLSSRDLSHSSS